MQNPPTFGPKSPGTSPALNRLFTNSVTPGARSERSGACVPQALRTEEAGLDDLVVVQVQQRLFAFHARHLDGLLLSRPPPVSAPSAWTHCLTLRSFLKSFSLYSSVMSGENMAMRWIDAMTETVRVGEFETRQHMWAASHTGRASADARSAHQEQRSARPGEHPVLQAVRRDRGHLFRVQTLPRRP